MMEFDYDVIVIGAGFAGLTAARELSIRGLSTMILEARDRIGGRTHTFTMASGDTVDLGGGHVNWTEPHLWSEVTRYGLEDELIDAGETIDHVCTPTAEGLKWCTPGEHYRREKALFETVFEPSRRVFPKPFRPLLMSDELAKYDISLEERLGQIGLSADDAAFLRSLFTTECGADLSEGSYLSLMRWYALAGHDYDRTVQTLFGYKFRHGTVTLANAIMDESTAELKLSTPVTDVAWNDDGVRVVTSRGEKLTAKVCIVATPSGVWADLNFAPELPEHRLKVSRERALQNPATSNIKLMLKGEPRRFYMIPELGHPIGMIWTAWMKSHDVQLAQAFQSPTMRDAADPVEVTAAVKDLLPHVEVLEVVSGTFYTDDPFSRGGYPMYRTGVLTREQPSLRLAEPEGRLVFATADISQFWNSFIDGAIESGIRAAQHVRHMLGDGQSPQRGQRSE
jgi:monoamine oxidase